MHSCLKAQSSRRGRSVVTTMKLSDYVMQFVAEQGVKHVFMLPGGGAMHLNESPGSTHRPGIRCQPP